MSKRDAVQQRLHVLEAAYWHANLPYFSLSKFVVRVVADLRRQIEGHGETRLALFQQVLVAAVGLFRRREPGVLPHGPDAAPVHVGLDSTGEGIFSRVTELVLVVRVLDVLRGIDGVLDYP